MIPTKFTHTPHVMRSWGWFTVAAALMGEGGPGRGLLSRNVEVDVDALVVDHASTHICMLDFLVASTRIGLYYCSDHSA